MTTSFAGYRPRQRPPTSARPNTDLSERMLLYKANGDAEVAKPFKGITADGAVAPGLFLLQQTGVSTQPIVDAAASFLDSLSTSQRAGAVFPLDSDAWRRWSNIHVYTMRHGAFLEEMSPDQLQRALGILEATLSPSGFQTARDIMKLNYAIGEITGRWEDYGEWLYWLSIMGTPSAEEPWGWQIDGHHLIVNCLVVGDQLVLTPTFMGSEPTAVHEGKYAGTRVFAAEEANGLATIRSFSVEHRDQAITGSQGPREVFTSAFKDNLELKAEGVRYGDLGAGEQAAVLKVIETYVSRMRAGHAEGKMAEVKRHLADTHFAWMGGFDDDSVFYYRVHSPIVLIEFDHQGGVALDNDGPSRDHIHTVVRTPNGNDYGKDLLRQHYERFHQ